MISNESSDIWFPTLSLYLCISFYLLKHSWNITAFLIFKFHLVSLKISVPKYFSNSQFLGCLFGQLGIFVITIPHC